MSEHRNIIASNPEAASHERFDVSIVGGIALDHEIGLPKPTYETLRRSVRGSNEAIEIIGGPEARQRLYGVVAYPGGHSRDELLDTVFDNFSGEAYGEQAWRAVISAWGESPEQLLVYGKFLNAYPHLAQLSLDPGFISYLDDFMLMAERGEVDVSDFRKVRQEFSEKLGEVTVWRGMSLTDDEMLQVKSNGIMSSLGLQTSMSEHPVEQFEAMALTTWPNHAIEDHFSNSHPASPFISVSRHKEIATAVGRSYSRMNDGKKFYLFQIKMPKINLIDYTDHGIRAPSMIQEFIDRDKRSGGEPYYGVKGNINGKLFDVKWINKVEQFGYWKIDSSDIVEITQPEITESTWNGRTTRTPLVDK